MYSQNQIDDFIKKKTGIDGLEPTDDLLNNHGVGGDDFHELIDEYAKAFGVDMTSYLWYFHAGEEGNFNIGGCFFKPPYKRVNYIAVTPLMLLHFANNGYWHVLYPPHKLPNRRWDLVFNKIFLVVIIAVVFYSCLK